MLGAIRRSAGSFAFATAVGATQLLALLGLFDASNARQIAARGSLSGAAIGGAAGTGVVLGTRGKEVEVAAGTTFTAKLARPLTLRVLVK